MKKDARLSQVGHLWGVNIDHFHDLICNIHDGSIAAVVKKRFAYHNTL